MINDLFFDPNTNVFFSVAVDVTKLISIDFLRKKRVEKSLVFTKNSPEFWSRYLIRLLKHHQLLNRPKIQIDSKGYYEIKYRLTNALDLIVTKWFRLPSAGSLPYLSLVNDYTTLEEMVDYQDRCNFFDQVSLNFKGIVTNSLDFYFYQSNQAELLFASDQWMIASTTSPHYLFDEMGEYDPYYVISGILDFIRNAIHQSNSNLFSDHIPLSS